MGTMHEEIAKALKMRLSELRTHLAKVEHELHKTLPADSEDQQPDPSTHYYTDQSTNKLDDLRALLRVFSAVLRHLYAERLLRASRRPAFVCTAKGVANCAAAESRQQIHRHGARAISDVG